MCRNTLLKSRALHSYSMNCRTYQNHKRKSNPSKQSGSVNIDWTGGSSSKSKRSNGSTVFSQGFHVAFGQNTQSSISTNRKIRSSTPCLFAARESEKEVPCLTYCKPRILLCSNSIRGIGFENGRILFVLWSTKKKETYKALSA